jgi:hypothetical protein
VLELCTGVVVTVDSIVELVICGVDDAPREAVTDEVDTFVSVVVV